MVVELISVGTEILMGNILNSNTQYLAEKCALLGLDPPPVPFPWPLHRLLLSYHLP